MVLSEKQLEIEIVKCKAAIVGFTDGVELHKIMLNALEVEKQKI